MTRRKAVELNMIGIRYFASHHLIEVYRYSFGRLFIFTVEVSIELSRNGLKLELGIIY